MKIMDNLNVILDKQIKDIKGDEEVLVIFEYSSIPNYDYISRNYFKLNKDSMLLFSNESNMKKFLENSSDIVYINKNFSETVKKVENNNFEQIMAYSIPLKKIKKFHENKDFQIFLNELIKKTKRFSLEKNIISDDELSMLEGFNVIDKEILLNIKNNNKLLKNIFLLLDLSLNLTESLNEFNIKPFEFKSNIIKIKNSIESKKFEKDLLINYLKKINADARKCFILLERLSLNIEKPNLKTSIKNFNLIKEKDFPENFKKEALSLLIDKSLKIISESDNYEIFKDNLLLFKNTVHFPYILKAISKRSDIRITFIRNLIKDENFKNNKNLLEVIFGEFFEVSEPIVEEFTLKVIKLNKIKHLLNANKEENLNDFDDKSLILSKKIQFLIEKFLDIKVDIFDDFNEIKVNIKYPFGANIDSNKEKFIINTLIKEKGYFLREINEDNINNYAKELNILWNLSFNNKNKNKNIKAKI